MRETANDSDRQAGTGVGPLPPWATERFETIFEEWRSEYPNQDSLEAGGLGNTKRLAALVFAWAKEILLETQK